MRRPFPETLARILARKDLKNLSPIKVVRIFAETTLIPYGHDVISGVAEGQKQNMPQTDGDAINDLCVISSAARNEQRRIADEVAGNAGQVTDAERIVALAKILDRVSDLVPSHLQGKHGIDMFALRFKEIGGRIARVKTTEELQHLLAKFK